VVAVPTVIAYILWMEGIRILGSSPATSFMFLAPVFALLIAAALLGERPTALQGAGGALMLLGVWLVNRPGEGKAPLKGRESPANP
ncbi:MAG: DMT family transporter, partial [Candidatus Deferrimicrobium sp.]